MSGELLHVQEIVEALHRAALGWKKHQQEARKEGRPYNRY
jgi:hypothetical protein